MMASFAHQMTANFTNEDTIRCQLTTTSALPIQKPVVCFSLLDACKPIEGCELLSSLGGFSEIKLHSDLAKGSPVEFEIAYSKHESKTMNRAWFPLGVYLKLPDGSTQPVRPLPAGVRRPDTAPSITDADCLKLVPPPSQWGPSGGTQRVEGFTINDGGVFPEAIASVDRLAKRNGFAPFLIAGGMPLTVNSSAYLSKSEYQLEIAPQGVEITANDPKGHSTAQSLC